VNTVISTRSYNLRGQVSALEVISPLGDVLDQSFTYGYVGGAPGPIDSGPNLDQVIDHRDASQSRFYFYDALDRLWKSTDVSGTPSFTYTYDANGNRTQQIAPAGTTNYAYQSSTDRIAQATGAAPKHYAHDAFGSRIWAGATAYAGSPSHIYDQSNRLIEVRDPATFAVLGQYTYDAAGRRVRKIAGGVTTLYLYDSAGHLVESRDLSTSPATRRSYVFIEDEPMGLVDQPPSGAPVMSWIHSDRLGTPLAVTSTPSSGPAKTIWRATYLPFGLATADEDPDGDSVSFALDLRLPGQLYDSESGEHYNFYRTYDPTAGRYLESDPIAQAGGINLLSYAESDPINKLDSEGLQAVPMGTALQPFSTPIPRLPMPFPIPRIPAPPPLIWVAVAGGAGYWVGTQIEPHVSPIIWPYLQRLADECGDKPDCEAQFATETQVCNAIAKRGGAGAKRRANLCHESAVKRYGACRAGDPPNTWPPFITWNN
jgi:RHS repeat-associated protein